MSGELEPGTGPMTLRQLLAAVVDPENQYVDLDMPILVYVDNGSRPLKRVSSGWDEQDGELQGSFLLLETGAEDEAHPFEMRGDLEAAAEYHRVERERAKRVAGRAD